MTAADFLRWLLALLQGVDVEPYVVTRSPEQTGGVEAIEVTIGGRRFRIRVEAIG